MNWLNTFWLGYWWPSIKGNGPEDLTSLLIVALLTAVLVPVVRRAIERFAQRHVDAIKAHVSAEHARIHQRMDALHKHLGIEEDSPDV